MSESETNNSTLIFGEYSIFLFYLFWCFVYRKLKIEKDSKEGHRVPIKASPGIF